MGLEEGPLSHTEISSSSEYESESETSIGSALPLYTSPPPIPPPSPPPIDSPPPYPIMSQHDLHAIICQQQEQLAAMQVQIQALLAATGGATGGAEREVAEVSRSYQMEVAKPAIFSGEVEKVGGFVTTCRLYLRMKMREAMVEKQVFWILLHMQGGSVDVWKRNWS